MANLCFKTTSLLAFVAIMLAQISRLSVNGQVVVQPNLLPLPEEVCGAEGYFVSPYPGFYFRCRLNLAIRRYILHRMKCPTSNRVQQVFQGNQCVPPIACTAQANSNCLCGSMATTCPVEMPFCDMITTPVCTVRCTPAVANAGPGNCLCGTASCVPKGAAGVLSVCDTTPIAPMMPRCIQECVPGAPAGPICQCGLKVCTAADSCTLAIGGAKDICAPTTTPTTTTTTQTPTTTTETSTTTTTQTPTTTTETSTTTTTETPTTTTETSTTTTTETPTTTTETPTTTTTEMTTTTTEMTTTTTTTTA